MTDNVTYSPVVADLLAMEIPNPLVPSGGVSEARPTLTGLSPAELFDGRQVTDRDMADGCLSGLWLRFDYLDRSHTISQEIHSSTGSFWHGIMHRREPDWSNSKYWFRQTGDHDIFPVLLQAANSAVAGPVPPPAQALLDSSMWDPFAFVDLCEAAHHQGGPLEDFCQRVQLAEWQLLFDYCYQHAIAN